MIDRSSPATEDELHAYLDGELPEDRRESVEAWLAVHPDDMARVAAWRAQIEAIRSHFGPAADEPVPPRFDLDRLMSNDRPWKAWIATAATIAFLVGGAGG